MIEGFVDDEPLKQLYNMICQLSVTSVKATSLVVHVSTNFQSVFVVVLYR